MCENKTQTRKLWFFSEYFVKICILHKNGLQTKCTQNVLKIIQRQNSLLGMCYNFKETNFTTVEQRKRRKNCAVDPFPIFSRHTNFDHFEENTQFGVQFLCCHSISSQDFMGQLF